MSDKSIRIPFDDTPFQKVAVGKDKIAAAAKEVKRYQDQILRAQRTGQEVSASVFDSLNKARDAEEKLRDMARNNQKRQAANTEERERTLGQQIHTYERMGHRLQRVFGDQMFQKLARGESIEAKDVARTVLYSDRALMGIGQALGANVGALRTALPYIQLATEAVMFGNEKFKQFQKEEIESQIVKLKVGSGEMSVKEGRLYENGVDDEWSNSSSGRAAKFGKFLMGTNAGAEAVEHNAKFTSVISQMKDQEIDNEIKTRDKELAARQAERDAIQDAFDQASPVPDDVKKLMGIKGLSAQRGPLSIIAQTGNALAEMFEDKALRITDKQNRNVTGREVKREIEIALKARRKKDHMAVLPEDIAEQTKRDVMMQYNVGKETLEDFEKGAALRAAKNHKLYDPAVKFNLDLKEKIYHSQVEVYARRVPANPMD